MNYYEPVQFFKLKPIHVLSRLELSYGDHVSFICDGKEVARLEIPGYSDYDDNRMDTIVTDFIINNHIDKYVFDISYRGYKPFYSYIDDEVYPGEEIHVVYVFRVKPI